MKRKDVDEVNDFFDYSIASPALKIRRLVAELTPITEEETVKQVPENEERAIVLFNNENENNTSQYSRPVSISADSDFLSRFKNPVIWSNSLNTHEPLVDETSDQENGCLAIVPWVPSHSEHTPTPEMENHDAQLLESDLMDVDAMDIEDDYNTRQIPKDECAADAASVFGSFSQWPLGPQHCMLQQPPNSFSTPISWYGRAA